MSEVMNPQSGQFRLVADAVPLVLDELDMARGRTDRKQEGTIRTVARE